MRNGRLLGIILVGLVGEGIAWQAASAQMFGPRTLGRPLDRRSSPGVSGDVGTLRNQRFIRGNRRATNFVGSDRAEARDFVGLEQTGPRRAVRSAVRGSLAGQDESYQINRPIQRAPAERPYDPRLEIGFEFRQRPEKDVAARINRRLSTNLTEGISVELEQRTAVLRGVVASEEDRQLAELLAAFEPGVSNVRNELAVAGDKEAIPPLRHPQDG